MLNSLSRGQRPHGDLIPWLVSQQFQDEEFASLSGARVVRIATNPEYMSMGYGSKALEFLVDYYEGRFASLSEEEDQVMQGTSRRLTDAELANTNLREEEIKVKDKNEMPPLFAKLWQTKPEALDYIGVSYGMTTPLHKFWKRASFSPVYLRQTANDLTGEHTCVMLRPLENSGDSHGLGAFSRDFQKRFLALLSFQFREFDPITALSIDESANRGARLDDSETQALTKAGLDALLTPFDLKRLESYGNNILDYHVILDLMPTIASLYFTGRIKSDVKLSGIQQAILLAIGLQRKDVDVICKELNLPSQQLLAMFIKVLRKVNTHFSSLITAAVDAELPGQQPGVTRENASGAHDDEAIDDRFQPLAQTLDEDLEEGGDEAMKELRQKQRALIDSLPLDQ